MGNAKSKQDKTSRLLWEAADTNNVAVAREQLKKGASPNAFGGDMGWTALMVAAYKGHASIVAALLAAGAAVDPKSYTGVTALMLAAGEGFHGITEDLVKHLLAPAKDSREKRSLIDAADEKGETALLKAASKGHSYCVQVLVAAGADVNVKDKIDGMSALAWAAQYGPSSIVSLLITSGADVNIRNHNGQTPLICAAFKNYMYQAHHRDILLDAAQKEQSLNDRHDTKSPTTDQQTSHGERKSTAAAPAAAATATGAAAAAVPPIAGSNVATAAATTNGTAHASNGAAVAAGAKPSATASASSAPAVGAAPGTIIAALTASGAPASTATAPATPKVLTFDPSTRDNAKPSVTDSPAMPPRSTSATGAAAAATAGAAVNDSALIPIAKSGLSAALDGGSAGGVASAKHKATPTDAAAGLSLSLGAAATDDGEETGGVTGAAGRPLDLAHTSRSISGPLSVVQCLIKAGAQINAKNHDGYTALMVAAWQGHSAVVDCLIKAKADPNMKAEKGQTALMMSVQQGHSSIAEDLIRVGANTIAADEKGETALIKAAIKGHSYIADCLIKAGADVNVKDNIYGNSAMHWACVNRHSSIVQSLIKAGANTNSKNHKGESALLKAASKAHSFTTECLINAGADVHASDQHGNTALTLAAIIGSDAVIEVLLESGVNINHKNHDGQTALILAIINNRSTTVELLVKGGADVNIKDNMYGKSAMDYVNFKPLLKTALQKAVDFRQALMRDLDAKRSGDHQREHSKTADNSTHPNNPGTPSGAGGAAMPTHGTGPFTGLPKISETGAGAGGADGVGSGMLIGLGGGRDTSDSASRPLTGQHSSGSSATGHSSGLSGGGISGTGFFPPGAAGASSIGYSGGSSGGSSAAYFPPGSHLHHHAGGAGGGAYHPHSGGAGGGHTPTMPSAMMNAPTGNSNSGGGNGGTTPVAVTASSSSSASSAAAGGSTSANATSHTNTGTRLRPSQWGVKDVMDWLKSISLEKYAAQFADASVDGALLLDLAVDQDLLQNDVGVSRKIHRMKIVREIKKLVVEEEEMEIEERRRKAGGATTGPTTPAAASAAGGMHARAASRDDQKGLSHGSGGGHHNGGSSTPTLSGVAGGAISPANVTFTLHPAAHNSGAAAAAAVNAIQAPQQPRRPVVPYDENSGAALPPPANGLAAPVSIGQHAVSIGAVVDTPAGGGTTGDDDLVGGSNGFLGGSMGTLPPLPAPTPIPGMQSGLTLNFGGPSPSASASILPTIVTTAAPNGAAVPTATPFPPVAAVPNGLPQLPPLAGLPGLQPIDQKTALIATATTVTTPNAANAANAAASAAAQQKAKHDAKVDEQHQAAMDQKEKRRRRIPKPRQIPYDELVLKQEIGRGQFGTVYLATWRGAPVAVKKLHSQSLTPEQFQHFVREAGLMELLGNHPNVVRFCGVCVLPPNLCIVTQFFEKGSLEDLLIKKSSATADLELKTLLQMAVDIAAGVLHLHMEGVIHRDLAARNLLVDGNMSVRVADFGMSRIKQNTTSVGHTDSNFGPLKWMSPEAILKHEYSEKSDAFSFGVTLWELLVRRAPYAGLRNLEAAVRVANESAFRLPVPKELPPAIAELMTDCWRADPKLRPNFRQLLLRIQRYIQSEAPELSKPLVIDYSQFK